MANGYKLDKGFLFDHTWEKQFRKLRPKDFYTVFWELYDYQRSGGITAVPEHDENDIMSSIVTFVVPQLRNRLNGSRRYFKSASASSGVMGGTPPPASTAHPTEGLRGRLLKLSRVKMNRVKLRERGQTPAHGTAEGRADISQKKAYGEFTNVLLSDSEYGAICERFGAKAQGLINNLSYKLRSKGYRFEDHYATLILWAERDGVHGAEEKSYDTDDFFEASLRREMDGISEDT